MTAAFRFLAPAATHSTALRSRARALVRSTQGVTAVELALILPVFMVLAFSVLEVGLEFLTQTMLDHAVAVGARQVEIGNATTDAVLRTDICNAAGALLIRSCSSSLQIYVTSGASFSGLSLATVSSVGTMSPTGVSAGTANSDVLVQVAYNRPYLFTLIGSLTGSKTNVLLSTIAVQNEPY